MNNQKKEFGFIRISYNPKDQELIYSKNSEDYLHLILFKERNLYFCTGMTPFCKEKIPAPYNLHEFTEFYRKIPPRITNNNDREINSLVQGFFC